MIDSNRVAEINRETKGVTVYSFLNLLSMREMMSSIVEAINAQEDTHPKIRLYLFTLLLNSVVRKLCIVLHSL